MSIERLCRIWKSVESSVCIAKIHLVTVDLALLGSEIMIFFADWRAGDEWSSIPAEVRGALVAKHAPDVLQAPAPALRPRARRVGLRSAARSQQPRGAQPAVSDGYRWWYYRWRWKFAEARRSVVESVGPVDRARRKRRSPLAVLEISSLGKCAKRQFKTSLETNIYLKHIIGFFIKTKWTSFGVFGMHDQTDVVERSMLY